MNKLDLVYKKDLIDMSHRFGFINCVNISEVISTCKL